MAAMQSARDISAMTRTHSLSSARSLAPEAFRRWVLGAVSVTVVGYGLMVAIDIHDRGLGPALRTSNAALVCVTAIAWLIAARVNETAGCALAILASWIEVETAFIGAPYFPTAGLLILPAMILGTGLLLGSRVALTAALVTIPVTIATCLTSPELRGAPLSSETVYWFTMHALSLLAVWVLHALSMSAYTRVFDAMEANEQDLADTIRFAPDGVLVATRDGRVILANPAAEAILRLPHDAVVEHTVSDILSRASGRTVTLDTLRNETRDASHDLELTSPGQAPVHVEVSWRRMERDRDQYLLRDVSARIRAEERRREMEVQLAHAQRLDAIGRLAGGLSHDFNNILTAVSGSAEMLRLERDPKQREELVGEIIAARDRGAALTRQLLAFARREVIQPRVIDLGSYVRGVERLLQRVAGDRQRLHMELVPDCHVRVDPGQLEQSLVNLVTNARDALPDGGTCIISVSRGTNDAGAARVLLRVTDDGVGMSPETIERAFEPFFTTKARGQGTGLGLASVHGMAEQSAGVAYITSTLHRGTQVTVELPLVDEAPVADTSRPGTSSLHAGTYTVLVAEDDAGTRRVVERILQHAGYLVQAVNDGNEAMALVESRTATFDLLVSDVMMPGHTGPEIADRMRILRPDTPVLLMTGYAEDQLSELMDNRTEREIITKPFAAELLTARVAELLRAPATAAPRLR
jgi:signal transduction histidine kinase